MAWPLQNLDPSQFNRSGRQALSKLFKGRSLGTPMELQHWHESQMHASKNSPIEKLLDSETRELYLLAMFAGTPFPWLEFGYDLGYEWYSVGSVLVDLDIPRIRVSHPNVSNLDEIIQAAISRAFDAFGESETLQEWLGFNNQMMEDHRRFRFGYEPILQALSIRALAAHHSAEVLQEDGLEAILDRDASLAIVGFSSDAKATAAGLDVLKGTIAALEGTKSQPQQWKHTLIRRLSGLYAHLWLYQGHAMADVVSRLQQRLELAVPALFDGITAQQQAAMVKTTMANFVACYPAAWSIAGIKAADFLGCSLLDRHLYDDLVRRTHESAFDPFVRKISTGSLFPKLALDYLGAIDASIFSPEHIDLEGSRTQYWDCGDDLKVCQDKVNAMLQASIWHPVLIGPAIADLADEDSAVESIRAFLEKGGKAASTQAKKMIERFPGLVDRFVDAVTKGSEVGRLATIASLTGEQIERIPEKFREAVLVADLGL